MRISDWSSDVCSSDLPAPAHRARWSAAACPAWRSPPRQAGSPAKRIYGKVHSWSGSFGRIQLAAPRQAVDVDAQGVLAQAFFGARRLEHDGHHGRPPLQARRGAVDVAAFRPAYVERRVEIG